MGFLQAQKEIIEQYFTKSKNNFTEFSRFLNLNKSVVNELNG